MIADRGDDPARRHLVRDRLCGREVERHRLLDEEGQGLGERGPLRRSVGEGRHADVDRVEFFLGQHVVELGIGAGAEALRRFAGPVFGRIREGREFHIVELLQHAHVAVGDAARADEAQTRPRHACSPGRPRFEAAINVRGVVRHAGGRE